MGTIGECRRSPEFLADQCLCPLERFPVAAAVPGMVAVAGPS